MSRTVFSFINESMPERSFNELVRVVSRRVKMRGCDVAEQGGDIVLRLCVKECDGSDNYSISRLGDEILVVANNVCTVFAAVGRLLTLGKFDCKESYTLPELPIEHTMKKSLRGMYFATHFYNFYHAAPFEETAEIIADLALRGYNTLMLVVGVQHYNSYADPEAQEMIAHVKRLHKYADLCGMAPAMIMFSNSGFENFPREFEAQSKIDDSGRYRRDLIAEYNTEICPSIPGGMAEIEKMHRAFFEAFKDSPIKYFFAWAYDEGGCLCEKCYPWVSNGFLKVCELDRKLIKEYGYDAELCISTWHFNLAMPNEWEIYHDLIESGQLDWSPYIMTAFQSGRLPDVFKEKGVPGRVKLIDFPDISMCGAKSWGGYGANPYTMFLDNNEKNCGYIHDGGFPYSEGIYEDINKWVCANYYCGYHEDAADAVREYIRYEFGVEDTEQILRGLQLMESALSRAVDRHQDKPWVVRIGWGRAIPETYRIITEADKYIPEVLRNHWKWRCVYLRAVIDYRLYLNLGVVKDDEIAQNAYKEIQKMFHLENAIFCVSAFVGK